MTKQEQLQDAFRKYQEAHEGVPHGTDVVVAWAVKFKHLELPEIDPLAVLAESMSQALRNEYGTDPATGRRYRKNHAHRVTRQGVQLSLWAEMGTAPRDHMEGAFQQRRTQIKGDCIQLKTDADVYNGRNLEQPPINLVFDFTYDIAEDEAADAIKPRRVAAG